MMGEKTPWGTLYGVGVGPGDPELVTLKAVRILRSVPVLFVPVRREGDQGYAWSIVQSLLSDGEQRVIRLPFPQPRGARALDQQWERNTCVMLDAMAGVDAAFLTEGDPLLYSSFLQVAGRLRTAAPGLPIEIVPGVSSITAGAAAAQQPLVDHGGRLAVLPAAYEADDLRRTLEAFDTVILLKVNRVLPKILAALDELGLTDRATLVERCGRPEQRVINDLTLLRGRTVDYFSLIIVRK